MRDEKQYTSFIVGVKRHHNSGKITTIIVGTKQKGKPADILSAYSGEEAQTLYNILVGRQVPAVTTHKASVPYSRLSPDKVVDNPDDLDIDII